MKKILLKTFSLFIVCLGILSLRILASQTTDTVFMVYPDDFQYNVETAGTNSFQNNVQDPLVKEKVLKEFLDMVKVLREHNIQVLTLHSRRDVKTPDAVFPNNWFLTVKNKETVNMILFPMFNKARSLERQEVQLKKLLFQNHIDISKVVDLTHFEKNKEALEGTGSLVLDRKDKIAYASLSSRTNPKVLKEFSKISGYRVVSFKSYDEKHELIYHTNVMMSVGDGFVVLCAECIKNPQEREKVLSSLRASHKTIILISMKQVHSMCGNILQVNNSKGEKIIVMSQLALKEFTETQREELRKFGKFLPVEISTIETIGGGSARCMLAEIFH